MRLTELINRRVVVRYKTSVKSDKGKANENDQQGIITHITQDNICLNVGKHELFVEKKKIVFITDMKNSFIFRHKK